MHIIVLLNRISVKIGEKTKKVKVFEQVIMFVKLAALLCTVYLHREWGRRPLCLLANNLHFFRCLCCFFAVRLIYFSSVFLLSFGVSDVLVIHSENSWKRLEFLFFKWVSHSMPFFLKGDRPPFCDEMIFYPKHFFFMSYIIFASTTGSVFSKF